MNIARMLSQSSLLFPDRPAISLGTKTLWDYAEFASRAHGLGCSLRDVYRLQRGARVAVVMANRPEYFEILFAIWTAGLCAVPMNARLHPKEIAFILESAEAAVCFVDRETETGVAPLVEQIGSFKQVISVDGPTYGSLVAAEPMEPAEVEPQDPAWLFYTSGTTGRPKGATLTHRNLQVLAVTHYADIDSMRSTDTMIHAAPLSHGCGLWSIASIGRAANNVVLESGSYDPGEVCRLLERWPSVSMYHAPTMVKRLINCREIGSTDTRNLNTLIYGGSHMYLADLQQALAILGPKLVQIYGQGESPNTISMLGKDSHAQSDHPHYLERLGSVGTARTGVEIRIADTSGSSVESGQLGEVLVRGDIVMAGYWRQPEVNAAVLAGGWLRTGDIGVLGPDGFLTLKDRAKDMIISGGSNIYPREIEEVLLQHASVLEVSVLGLPHQEWGEEVVACVVPRPGAEVTASELDGLCLESIARYKRPRAYHFVASLPKSNYGKILKTELRRQLIENRGG
jgi:long-chain acyl-CoA synthetase